MRTVNQMDEQERTDLVAAVKKDLRPIERKHGEDQTRYAINRVCNERRDRRRLQKKKRELEAELAALDK